jgi:4a-hydroxytetrahydrobiopterin dehydratase
MPAPKLSDADVQGRLAGLNGWSVQDGALIRTYVFPDFVRAMAFVNAVADAAEAAQHHPDIDIRYSKVTLALVTHDSGGITEADFALAAEADQHASAA